MATEVKQWVRDIVERGAAILEVGETVIHVPTGRQVKITSGQFWGTYGVSNFWYWHEVMPDGTLSDVKEHGYGTVLKRADNPTPSRDSSNVGG